MFHRFSNKYKKRCVVLLNSTSKMINVDFLLLVSFLHMFCFVEVILVQTKKVININEKRKKEYHIHLLFFCNDRLKKQSNFFSVVYINREKHP